MGEKEKIKKYLEYKGISKNKFYVRTGLSVGFLDSGKSLGVDKARIILNIYSDLNPDWLILDKGEMLKPESPETEKTLKSVSGPELSRHIDELTEVIKTQAKTLFEQQQFINATIMGNRNSPPLIEDSRYPENKEFNG